LPLEIKLIFTELIESIQNSTCLINLEQFCVLANELFSTLQYSDKYKILKMALDKKSSSPKEILLSKVFLISLQLITYQKCWQRRREKNL